MPNEWLSLGDVAHLLGVHPSTVRSWSDQGQLPVHRTQGGHRRYKTSDIEMWLQYHQDRSVDEGMLVVQNTLKNTRLQVGDGVLETEQWYQKLDEEARAQYRYSGRNLLQGLLELLSTDGSVADSEARSLGYEYASRGWRYGLTAAEATRAFMFFRNMLLESLLVVSASAAVHSPIAWKEMLRKITDFTDQIQITLLETYDGYQRGAH